MPIFNIGSGNPFKLPVLDSAYPADVSQLQQSNGTATFEVKIETHGIPDEYTYQWYVDGVAVTGETSSTYTRNGLSSAATHTVYCVVTSKAGSVQSRTAVLTVKDLKPEYTYSGTASLVDDGSGNYRLKFLTSGKLKFTELGCFANGIDVFCVGGGGGGGLYGDASTNGSGGAGGYTTTSTNIAVEVNKEYTITVGGGGAAATNYADRYGKAGGASSAFSVEAKGGGGGNPLWDTTSKANGGSGGGGANGDGGTDGSNGKGTNAGKGQGKTTREFGDSSATVYAGGGGGGATGKGGNGGGGNAAGVNGTAGAGKTNTGGGGGGGTNTYDYRPAAAGGSGIVIIRNKR